MARTARSLAVTLLALGLAPRALHADTPDRLEAGARVFVRDTLVGAEVAGDTTWIEDRTLDSARASLSFRPSKRTRLDLEVELAGDQAELKDTFVRHAPLDWLDVSAGRFKRPVSFVGLTSTWKLPRIDRGLLSELRVDDRRLLFAGGRGEGVAVRLRPPLARPTELTVTVHESDLADDLGLEVTEGNQDLFARAEVEPVTGVAVAVAGGLIGALTRAGEPASYRHRGFATLEARVDTAPVRLWLEAMTGTNTSVAVDGALAGRFLAAQALVAPRLERVLGLRALEPYAAIGWYDPTSRRADDRTTELTGGAALWISGTLRLQLEGGRRLAEGPAAVAGDATIVRVQLGAAFTTKLELPE